MNNTELKQILENHLHWLREDCEGWENMRANLQYANLRYANLRYANLQYADLQGTDLRGADLRYANLQYADLQGTDLRGADLQGADLQDANLQGADFQDANLQGAYNLVGLYLPTTCPSDGEFTAWKKCHDGVIAKLLIPADAKRTSATGRKCRASEATVLALYDRDGNKITKARSDYDNDFVYRVGKTVKPKEPFDENRWNECASGIHFFVTREEAERY